MKLYGPAGNFEVEVTDLNVNDDFIALSTKMGVWQQSLMIDHNDAKKLISMFFRFSVFLFLLKSFTRSIFK